MNLWHEKGVPHKGWECVEVIDLGEDARSCGEIDYEQCEMCGEEDIRYVHIIGHLLCFIGL